MLFPLMGLLMVFVPLAGFLAGIALLCIRPLRFLAPYAFLVPFSASYGAVAGFWGLGLAVESLGFGASVSGWACVFGLLTGGALGAAVSIGGVSFFLIRRLRTRDSR